MSDQDKWYKQAYKRVNIDCHMEDWHPEFMGKFNAKEFVDIVASSNLDSVMLYTKCHIGNCYYDTKIGHKHKNLGDIDAFGEQLSLFHEKGIKVIAYYSVIFSNRDYEEHPDWRQINLEGNYSKHPTLLPRYGMVCPNSPYRDKARQEVAEIVSNYDIDGFFFDMNFFFMVCYCKYCQEKYQKRFGTEMPRKIDWDKPEDWDTFLRWREDCIYEFTRDITDTVKKIKRHIPVNHQYQNPSGKHWIYAQPLKMAELADYLGLDAGLSEEHLGQSVLCKLYRNLSCHSPIELHILKLPNPLQSHTGIRQVNQLRSNVACGLAHNGATAFIDAINPDGTLYPLVYKHIGEAFRDVDRYKPFLGGRPLVAVGVYLSDITRRYFTRGGSMSRSGGSFWNVPETEYVKGFHGFCKTLLSLHIPFDVFTERNLNDLDKYQAVMLPNTVYMSRTEIDAFSQYVEGGGGLLATKLTSIGDDKFKYRKDFALSSLFGAHYIGETENKENYISIVDTNHAVTKGIPPDMPLYSSDYQAMLEAKGAKVLGRLTLPYTDRKNDMDKFCSIHSSPPGIDTDHPALLVNNYGKGRVCYISAAIEKDYEPNFSSLTKCFLANCIRWTMGEAPPFWLSSGPTNLECTAFLQDDKKRIVFHLVNFQVDDNPSVVYDVTLNVKIPEGVEIKKVIMPLEGELKYEISEKIARIFIPRVEIYRVVVLEMIK